jgi:hypothetical protein
MKYPLSAAILAALATPAFGQTNVDPINKYSWSENCGWMDWRDDGTPMDHRGAFFRPRFLSGFIWCENTGWINLGDGTPGGPGGASYLNVNGADSGVNVDTATGRLSGYAWGENIGWINFAGGNIAGGEGAAARISLTQPRRLLGYAWAENVGWINLNDATHYVGVHICACDFTADGFLNSQDFFDFLTAFFSLTPSADFNSDGYINSQDFFDFLSCFFGGC